MRAGPAAALVALTLAGCEAAVAGFVKRRITVGGRRERNPLPDTPEVAAGGREAFSHFCAACHGLDGQRTGVPFAAAMSPPVPSLASSEVQAYADGQLHEVIVGGLFPSGMPAARGILNDEEIWSIVRFLRHLPPAGSLGEPSMYGPGEPCAGAAGR